MTSLACAVFTTLGAVLGKQWPAYYEEKSRPLPPADRERERHCKFLGARVWHLKSVFETLPTLLPPSLFIFLVALINLFWSLDKMVAGPIIIFT